jgi:uncharacterized protein YpbB
MEHKISFVAQGTIYQTIKILNGDSIETVIEKLNNGQYVTTVHENKKIEVTESGRVVAEIIDTDNQLEYSDFEAE